MNKSLIMAAIVAVSASALQAQTYGRVAYPDNWQGGPPLPPVGQSRAYIQQPQGYYVQPRAQYIQPQEYYVRPYYVQPRVVYAQPQALYAQPQAYVSRAYTATYNVQPRPPLVSGPPQSRCVVANLNGTAWQQGCGMVTINPADAPMLRQKFSAYRPNSGYVLNLPADSDYR